MASDIDICNMALSIIGSDAVVASIDPVDGTVEAGHCARFFRIARGELLDMHAYTFAKKRALLAEVANISDVWQYAYALPSDCMVPKRILLAYQYDWSWFYPEGQYLTADEWQTANEQGSADFEIEGTTLLCNEQYATLIYTIDPLLSGLLSPKFTVAFAHLLASYLAGPLVKGEAGMKMNAGFRQLATRLASEAAAIDANSSSERAAQFVPGPIAARA